MSKSETSTDVTEDEKTFFLPEYYILVWNDATSDFNAVAGLIQEVFSYSEMEAYELTMGIHKNTNAMVWSGTHEVGELRLHQCYEFIKNNIDYLKELKVTLEEGT